MPTGFYENDLNRSDHRCRIPLGNSHLLLPESPPLRLHQLLHLLRRMLIGHNNSDDIYVEGDLEEEVFLCGGVWQKTEVLITVVPKPEKFE